MEYVVTIANLFTKTVREERIEDDEPVLVHEKAQKLCKAWERIVSVEPAKKRRFMVLIERTQVYRTYVEEDSYGEAVDEARHQVDNGMDRDWEFREDTSCRVIHVEEGS